MGKIVYHGGKVDGKGIAAVSDRQTDRQTDRQADRGANTQTRR